MAFEENVFDSVLNSIAEDSMPVKTTQTGKKLSTTACVNEIVNAIVNVIASTNADAIVEATMPKIKELAAKEIGIIPPRVEIKINDQFKIIQGATHEKFHTVLQMVNLDVPVYLTGPAGTGKNVICKQVAESLGLDFYFTNAVTQEYKLTGFIDANGNYQKTQFYDAFTKGGLFFLDEMDASVPETLVILNAAIANRYFDFPCGKIEAHPDFRIIAAGNTKGTGADISYTGRYSLDRASLDRFAMVEIGYSPAIENAVTDSNEELISFCHFFRDSCNEAGVECLFSYRTLERINKLDGILGNLSEVIDSSLIKGLDKDTLRIIKDKFSNEKISGNRYAKALKLI